MVFMGWDDRIANGWCGTCNQEAQLALATLVIRTCKDLARSLVHAGARESADKYVDVAANLTARLRASSFWPLGFGLHAASNAVNANVANDAEILALFSQHFNDSTSICSWSPFNQYYILQSLGNMGMMEYALASVRLCWGTMLDLGRGCFWELYSPEWATFMKDGEKAPTMPSYCHPWSSIPSTY